MKRCKNKTKLNKQKESIVHNRKMMIEAIIKGISQLDLIMALESLTQMPKECKHHSLYQSLRKMMTFLPTIMKREKITTNLISTSLITTMLQNNKLHSNNLRFNNQARICLTYQELLIQSNKAIIIQSEVQLPQISSIIQTSNSLKLVFLNMHLNSNSSSKQQTYLVASTILFKMQILQDNSLFSNSLLNNSRKTTSLNLCQI